MSELRTFTTAKRVELWCAEPVFFASRELSDTYYTEGTIGNYALAYALGWARSPYRLTGKDTGRPKYLEHLTPLAEECYILPAWSVDDQVSFRFERFNALSDAYWYAMVPNRVATAREDLQLTRYLKKQGKKVPKGFQASNFPQTGRLRMIERNNRFQTIIFGDRAIPEYIRVGKFTSKVRVEIVEELEVESLPMNQYNCNTYLSSADLPPNLQLLAFDVISIPPVSLIKNLQFYGEAWRVGEFIVPANLQFCGGRNDELN